MSYLNQNLFLVLCRPKPIQHLLLRKEKALLRGQPTKRKEAGLKSESPTWGSVRFYELGQGGWYGEVVGQVSLGGLGT